MCRAFGTMCLLAALAAAGDVRAGSVFTAGDDALLLAGLIPGEFLTEQELDQYYGRGVSVNFNLGDQGSFNLDGFQFGNNGSTINSADSSTLTNDSLFSDNSGIFQNIPVIGDGNQVVINVAITVNMNTVSVEDSSGASILINQTLDFGGSISAFE